jgi:Spy/CpxP family protein refolding chaperone
LARSLNLNPEQTAELAAILDDLKNQREQARVDEKKAVSAFADVFMGGSFDKDRIEQVTAARAKSAAEVEAAVAKALQRTFELLDAEQRRELSFMLRSGALTI